jgi:hypothetical protein
MLGRSSYGLSIFSVLATTNVLSLDVFMPCCPKRSCPHITCLIMQCSSYQLSQTQRDRTQKSWNILTLREGCVRVGIKKSKMHIAEYVYVTLCIRHRLQS